MGHVVHYRTPSGEPRLEAAESLDAALAQIERLRNDLKAEDVRLFREIPLEVRTYFKVAIVDEPAAAPTGRRPEPVAEAVTTPSVEPLPGAVTLSPPPAVVHAPEPEEETEPEPPRRSSLFTRSG